MNGLLLLAAMVAQPAAPPASAPASAPAYQEERFGPWLLRTDPRAHTFGVLLIPTGVIELAARSADGNAAWIIRDNGTILTIELRTPRCTLLGRPGNLEAIPSSVPALDDCHIGAYRAEIAQWEGALAPALAAMKARARARWPDQPERCIEPEPPVPNPGEIWIPPPHPPCGFPPPEIGQYHLD